MQNSHSSIYFFDTDLRRAWFGAFGVSSALNANERLKDVSHRLIHQDKVVHHVPQKELF